MTLSFAILMIISFAKAKNSFCIIDLVMRLRCQQILAKTRSIFAIGLVLEYNPNTPYIYLCETREVIVVACIQSFLSSGKPTFLNFSIIVSCNTAFPNFFPPFYKVDILGKLRLQRCTKGTCGYVFVFLLSYFFDMHTSSQLDPTLLFRLHSVFFNQNSLG